jgi:ankyrin repeat protein
MRRITTASQHSPWRVQRGRVKLFASLLKHKKVNAATRDQNGSTILIQTIDIDNIDVLRELVKDERVDVHSKNYADVTASDLVVRVMKQFRCERDRANVIRDLIRQSKLFWASANGRLELVRSLLKHDRLEVNVRTNQGRTSLILASEKGHWDVIRELLGLQQIDVNAQDNDGHTSLMLASGVGHVKVVQELLRHQKVMVHTKDSTNGTSLILASGNGHMQIVRELLKHEALDVNAANDDGCTALILACYGGHLDVVCELLKHENVDVNAIRDDGTTALILASAMLSCVRVMTVI